MKQYFFKNFTTNEEALERWQEIEAVMPEILNLPLEQWNSLKVLHDEPEVWRLWMQCGKVRINLHLFVPCNGNNPFFHFHPWPSVVRCVKGAYFHNMGTYPWDEENMIAEIMKYQHEEGYVEEMALRSQEFITPVMTQVVPGSMYMMTDIRKCHQVIVPDGTWNSSVMVTGTPYFSGASELLSRKKPGNNPVLTENEKIKVINPLRKYYGLPEW